EAANIYRAERLEWTQDGEQYIQNIQHLDTASDVLHVIDSKVSADKAGAAKVRIAKLAASVSNIKAAIGHVYNGRKVTAAELKTDKNGRQAVILTFDKSIVVDITTKAGKVSKFTSNMIALTAKGTLFLGKGEVTDYDNTPSDQPPSDAFDLSTIPGIATKNASLLVKRAGKQLVTGTVGMAVLAQKDAAGNLKTTDNVQLLLVNEGFENINVSMENGAAATGGVFGNWSVTAKEYISFVIKNAKEGFDPMTVAGETKGSFIAYAKNKVQALQNGLGTNDTITLKGITRETTLVFEKGKLSSEKSNLGAYFDAGGNRIDNSNNIEGSINTTDPRTGKAMPVVFKDGKIEDGKFSVVINKVGSQVTRVTITEKSTDKDKGQPQAATAANSHKTLYAGTTTVKGKNAIVEVLQIAKKGDSIKIVDNAISQDGSGSVRAIAAGITTYMNGRWLTLHKETSIKIGANGRLFTTDPNVRSESLIGSDKTLDKYEYTEIYKATGKADADGFYELGLTYEDVESGLTAFLYRKVKVESEEKLLFAVKSKVSNNLFVRVDVDGMKLARSIKNIEVTETLHCAPPNENAWFKLKKSTFEAKVSLYNNKEAYLGEEGGRTVVKEFRDSRGKTVHGLTSKDEKRNVLGAFDLPNGKKISLAVQRVEEGDKVYEVLVSRIDAERVGFESLVKAGDADEIKLAFNKGKADVRFEIDGSITTLGSFYETEGRELLPAANISLMDNFVIKQGDLWAPDEGQAIKVGDQSRLRRLAPPPRDKKSKKTQSDVVRFRPTKYDANTQKMWGLMHIKDGAFALYKNQILHIRGSDLSWADSGEWVMAKVSELDSGKVRNYLVYNLSYETIKGWGVTERLSVQSAIKEGNLWVHYADPRGQATLPVTFDIVVYNGKLTFGKSYDDLSTVNGSITAVLANDITYGAANATTWHSHFWLAHAVEANHYRAYVKHEKEILAAIIKVTEEEYGFKEGVSFESDGIVFTSTLKGLALGESTFTKDTRLRKRNDLRALFGDPKSSESGAYNDLSIEYALSTNTAREHLYIRGKSVATVCKLEIDRQYYYVDKHGVRKRGNLGTLIYINNFKGTDNVSLYMEDLGYVNALYRPDDCRPEDRIEQTTIGGILVPLFAIKDKIDAMPQGAGRGRADHAYKELESRVEDALVFSRYSEVEGSDIDKFNDGYEKVNDDLKNAQIAAALKTEMIELNNEIGSKGLWKRGWEATYRTGVAALHVMETNKDIEALAMTLGAGQVVGLAPAMVSRLGAGYKTAVSTTYASSKGFLRARAALGYGSIISARLYRAFLFNVQTTTTVGLSAYTAMSFSRGETPTAQGAMDVIRSSVKWSMVFTPLAAIGTPATIGSAFQASNVKWFGSHAFSLKHWRPLSIYKAYQSGEKVSGWLIVGWSAPAFGTFYGIHEAVGRGRAISADLVAESVKQGFIAATALALMWTAAGGYKALSRTIHTDQAIVAESALPKAPQYLRVALNPKRGILGSIFKPLSFETKAISPYSLFFYGATGRGLYQAIANPDNETGFFNRFYSGVRTATSWEGIKWGLGTVGGTTLIVNFFWSGIVVGHKGLGKVPLVTKIEIFGDTPGFLGATGVGRFAAALLHPRTAYAAYNQLLGQAFGVGGHMIIFTAIGKGFLTPVSTWWLRPHEKSGETGTAAVAGWLSRGIENFGANTYIDAAIQGFIFGAVLAPLGAAMEVSGQFLGGVAGKIPGSKVALKWVGESTIATEAMGVAREAYLEGSASFILQGFFGISPGAAEVAVELIPGIGGRASSRIRFYSRANSSLKRLKPVTLDEQVQKRGFKVGDVLSEEEISENADRFEAMGIRFAQDQNDVQEGEYTAAGISGMSLNELTKHQNEHAAVSETEQRMSSFDLLDNMHEIKTGHEMSNVEFAGMTGQSLPQLQDTYEVEFTIMDKTEMAELTDYVKVEDLLGSEQFKDSVEAIEAQLEADPSMNSNTSVAEFVSKAEESVAASVRTRLSENRQSFAAFVDTLSSKPEAGAFAEKCGLILTPAYVTPAMSLTVFMYESGTVNRKVEALQILGFTAEEATTFLKANEGRTITVGMAARHLAGLGKTSIAAVLNQNLLAKKGFELIPVPVRAGDSLADLARNNGLSEFELLEVARVTKIVTLEHALNIAQGTLAAQINKDRAETDQVTVGASLEDVRDEVGPLMEDVEFSDLSEDARNLLVTRLGLIEVKIIVARIGTEQVADGKGSPYIEIDGIGDKAQKYDLTRTTLARLENDIATFADNPYVDFVLEASDYTKPDQDASEADAESAEGVKSHPTIEAEEKAGSKVMTRIDLKEAVLSIDETTSADGKKIPVLSIANVSSGGGIQRLVDFNGDVRTTSITDSGSGLSFAIKSPKSTKEMFDQKTGKFNADSVTLTITDLEDGNIITEGHNRFNTIEQIKQALYTAVEEMRAENTELELHERDKINPIEAILSVAFVKNTFFEIPTGFGKTKTVMKAVVRINSILKKNGAMPGRHTIYITHDSNQFKEIATKNNPMNIDFDKKELDIVALCQNGEESLADPKPETEQTIAAADQELEARLADSEAEAESGSKPKVTLNEDIVTQITLGDIQKDPEAILKRLTEGTNGTGVDLIYMDADTFMFLQLSLLRNAKADNAAVSKDIWNQIFSNAKVLHDEVDTAFFRNRAQEGLDARALDADEIRRLSEVDGFINTDADKLIDQAENRFKIKENMTGKDYVEAQWRHLKFKIKRKDKIQDWTYGEWVDNGKPKDYIEVYFDQAVHVAFMKWVSGRKGVKFNWQDYSKGDKGEDAALEEFYRTQDPETVAYRQSMVGRTNALMQYYGGDVALDGGPGGSQLIKPAPHGILAPQLQLSDPYFAGHTELIFKRYLNKTPYLVDDPKRGITGVRISNLSTVTSMAAAMVCAIESGADFGGFSGTLKSVEKFAEFIFNIEVNMDMGSKISAFIYESRITSLTRAHDWDVAKDHILGRIRGLPVAALLDGSMLHNDDPGVTINELLESGKVVLYKERDNRWTLHVKPGISVDIKLSAQNGDIAVENFMTELALLEKNPEYRDELMQKLQALGLSEYSAGEVLSRSEFKEADLSGSKSHPARRTAEPVQSGDPSGGLVFYLNAPATRATNIELTELLENIKPEGVDSKDLNGTHSEIECFGIIDSGTNMAFFEQLAGRDRGIRHLNEAGRCVDVKDGNENRIYHRLHVYRTDATVEILDEAITDSAVAGPALKKFLTDVTENTDKIAFFNIVAELIDIRGAEFLSRLKDNEGEQGRDTLHEIVMVYQSFIKSNDNMDPEAREAKDPVKALQERVDKFMTVLQQFRDNEGKFKIWQGRFDRLSDKTRDAINAELEIFEAGRMDLHIQESLPAKASSAGVGFAPTMSSLVRRLDASVSREDLPEIPPMAGADAAAIKTDEKSMETAYNDAGVSLDVEKEENEKRDYYDPSTGKYTVEAAVAAQNTKEKKKSKVAAAISLVLKGLFSGMRGTGDDEEDAFHKTMRMMDEGYLSKTGYDFKKTEAKVLFVNGLVKKGMMDQSALADDNLMESMRYHASGVQLAKALLGHVNRRSSVHKALRRYISMQRSSYFANLYKFREHTSVNPYMGLPTQYYTPILASVFFGRYFGLLGQIGFIHAYMMIGGGLLPDVSIMLAKAGKKVMGAYHNSVVGWHSKRIVSKDIGNMMKQMTTKQDVDEDSGYIVKYMLSLARPDLHMSQIDMLVDSHLAYRKIVIEAGGDINAANVIQLTDDIRPALEAIRRDITIYNKKSKKPESFPNTSLLTHAINNDIVRIDMSMAKQIKPKLNQVPINILRQRQKQITKNSKWLSRMSSMLDISILRVPMSTLRTQEAGQGLLLVTAVAYIYGVIIMKMFGMGALAPDTAEASGLAKLKSGMWGNALLGMLLTASKPIAIVITAPLRWIPSIGDRDQAIQNARRAVEINFDDDAPEQIKKDVNRAMAQGLPEDDQQEIFRLVDDIKDKRERLAKEENADQQDRIEESINNSIIELGRASKLSESKIGERLAWNMATQVYGDANIQEERSKARARLEAEDGKAPSEKRIEDAAFDEIFGDAVKQDIGTRSGIEEAKMDEMLIDMRDGIAREYKGITIEEIDGKKTFVVADDADEEARDFAVSVNAALEQFEQVKRTHPEVGTQLEKLMDESTFRIDGKPGIASLRVRKSMPTGANAERNAARQATITRDGQEMNVAVVDFDQAFVEFVVGVNKTHARGAGWILLERFGHELCHTDISHRTGAVGDAAEEIPNKYFFDYRMELVYWNTQDLRDEVDDIFEQYGEAKRFSSAHFYQGTLTRKEGGKRVVIPEAEMKIVLWEETVHRLIEQAKQSKDLGADYIDMLKKLEGEEVAEKVKEHLENRGNKSLAEVRQGLHDLLAEITGMSQMVAMQEAYEKMEEAQTQSLIDEGFLAEDEKDDEGAMDKARIKQALHKAGLLPEGASADEEQVRSVIDEKLKNVDGVSLLEDGREDDLGAIGEAIEKRDLIEKGALSKEDANDPDELEKARAEEKRQEHVQRLKDEGVDINDDATQEEIAAAAKAHQEAEEAEREKQRKDLIENLRKKGIELPEDPSDEELRKAYKKGLLQDAGLLEAGGDASDAEVDEAIKELKKPQGEGKKPLLEEGAEDDFDALRLAAEKHRLIQKGLDVPEDADSMEALAPLHEMERQQDMGRLFEEAQQEAGTEAEEEFRHSMPVYEAMQRGGILADFRTGDTELAHQEYARIREVVGPARAAYQDAIIRVLRDEEELSEEQVADRVAHNQEISKAFGRAAKGEIDNDNIRAAVESANSTLRSDIAAPLLQEGIYNEEELRQAGLVDEEQRLAMVANIATGMVEEIEQVRQSIFERHLKTAAKNKGLEFGAPETPEEPEEPEEPGEPEEPEAPQGPAKSAEETVAAEVDPIRQAQDNLMHVLVKHDLLDVDNLEKARAGDQEAAAQVQREVELADAYKVEDEVLEAFRALRQAQADAEPEAPQAPTKTASTGMVEPAPARIHPALRIPLHTLNKVLSATLAPFAGFMNPAPSPNKAAEAVDIVFNAPLEIRASSTGRIPITPDVKAIDTTCIQDETEFYEAVGELASRFNTGQTRSLRLVLFGDDADRFQRLKTAYHGMIDIDIISKSNTRVSADEIMEMTNALPENLTIATQARTFIGQLDQATDKFNLVLVDMPTPGDGKFISIYELFSAMFTTGKISGLFTSDEERRLREIYRTEGVAGLFVRVRPRSSEEIEMLRESVKKARQAA
ncbi:MAG: hypothetical protein HQ558_03455, partial [Candidatus Omnitrophica bacterium]|nr:hypothetical protein [Candidatus Omnitrophota bacterium]